MPDKLQALYDNLTKLNPDFKVPVDQFRQDMQDENKLKTLHTNLSKNYPDFKVGYDQFRSDMWSTNPSPAPATAPAPTQTKASAFPDLTPEGLSFQEKPLTVPGGMASVLPTEVPKMPEVRQTVGATKLAADPIQVFEQKNIVPSVEQAAAAKPEEYFKEGISEVAGAAQPAQAPQLSTIDALKVDYIRRTKGEDAAAKFEQELQQPSFVPKLGKVVGSGLMSGVTSLGSWVADAPGFIYNLAGDIFRAAGMDVKRAEEFKGGALEQVSDYFKKQSAGYEKKLDEINPNRKLGIQNAFETEGIGAGILNLSESIAQSLPASIAMILGGGATLPTILSSATVFGAGKAQEMAKLAPEMNADKRDFVAAINGSLEGVFETLLGSGAVARSLKSIIAKEGADVAKSQVKKSLSEMFSKMLTENPWLAPLGEGFEEIGTQISQNIVDKYSGYRPNIKITDGVADAAWAGIGMGGLHGTVLGLAKATLADQKKAEFTVARDQAAQTVRQNFDALAQPDGNLHVGVDKSGNEVVIVSQTPGGMAILQDGTIVDIADINDIQLHPFESLFGQQMAEFDAANDPDLQPAVAPQVQSTFNWNGRTMQLTDVSDRNDLMVQEIDKEGEPVGRPEKISAEEYRKVIEQQVDQPEAQPELRTYDLAGKQVPFTPKEDGTLVSEDFKTPEEAEAAKAELEKQIGAANDVTVNTVPGPDNLTPATYQLAVTPKTEDVTEQLFTEAKPEPTDQLFKEGEASYVLNGQPIERGKAMARVKSAIFEGNRKKIENLEVSGDKELTDMIEKAFPIKITIGKKKASTEDALNWIDAADTIEELRKLSIEGAPVTNDIRTAYTLKVKELSPEISPEEVDNTVSGLFAPEAAEQKVEQPIKTKEDDSTNIERLSSGEPRRETAEQTGPDQTGGRGETATGGNVQGDEQVSREQEQGRTTEVRAENQRPEAAAEGQGLKPSFRRKTVKFDSTEGLKSAFETENVPVNYYMLTPAERKAMQDFTSGKGGGAIAMERSTGDIYAFIAGEGKGILLRKKKKPSPSKLADLYKTRLSKLKKDNPKRYWSVDLPSDEDLLSSAKDGRLIDMAGGMAYVTKDGDLKGLFKYDPEAHGTAKVLQAERIKLGGIKLDAFDTEGTGEVSLVPTYKKNGFREVARVDFNPEFAPEDMPENVKAMNPDVVVMVYDPENKLPIKERRFNKGQYEEALAYRDSYITEEPVPDHNKSADTQAFFSDVVTGTSDKFKPKKPWEPILPFTEKEQAVRPVFDKFNGNFDTHIATSIPAFRDVQIKVVSALNQMYGKKGGLIYDIGGSEGGFVKAITELSDGRMKSINLDANGDMGAVHNATPVEGSTFIKEAFGEGFEWDGVEYPRHEPKQKADVVHESMTFQFIDEKRADKVNEVVDNYLKPDGLFITEEKVHPKSQEQWTANEAKKDTDFKSRYYESGQISAKKEEVLTGMVTNQTTYERYKNELRKRFDFVEEYWDGGNFKGLVASNDKAKVDQFLNEVGNTDTEFSEKNIPIGGKPSFKKKPFSLNSLIKQAAAETDTNPTEAQIEAGNYKKGHVNIQGMDVSIENPKGSVRSGVDEDGKAWETEMKSHYGYFRGTVGKDGDHIDVFVGPKPANQFVFVIDQNDPRTGEFDESKVMLGYDSAADAKAAYLANYEPGWNGFGAITEVPMEQFKGWLYDGARQRKPFGEYVEVKKPISFQARKLYAGLEKVPEFNNLTELTAWLQKWSKKNKVFASDEAKADDDKFVKALVKHTIEELKAFEELSDYPYIGFYDYDIPARLNPELAKFAEKRYGHELSPAQVALYHLVSGFASPSADPVMDSSKGLDVFDKYMRTGKLTSASDKQATVWEVNEQGKKVDTGKPKFDEQGNPVFSQVTVAYATPSLNKFRDNVLGHFKGDLDKAIDWITSVHSYDEIARIMGVPTKGKGSLEEHENLTKADGGFGIFGFTGPKLGSYILNRLGNFSTVTKDLWYARTMARLTGESLQEKTGEALKLPWNLTAEGKRKRALADKAWSIVADKLGITPADVQQRMWEFEKRLYEKLGAKGSSGTTGYASEGFMKRAKELEPDLFVEGEEVKPSYRIKVEQAKRLSYKTELPDSDTFKEAVSNTPDSRITEDGLIIKVIRFQKEEQEGSESVRTGVFYLPASDPNVKHYKGKTGYGGKVKQEGETLIKKPIFVKGATGGKAPEAAYDQINGKGEAKKLSDEILNSGVLGQYGRRIDPSEVYNFLEEHGSNGDIAWNMVEVSKQGNLLRYAIQENIIAHAVREAGYDAVVGYSTKRDGSPFISEIFDVRETTYPSNVFDSDIHDAFLEEQLSFRKGTPQVSGQNSEAKPFIEQWESDAKFQTPVFVLDNAEIVDRLAERYSKESLQEIRDAEFWGLQVDDEMYIHPDTDPETALLTWAHEKSHIVLENQFPDIAERNRYLRFMHRTIGEKELHRVLPDVYWDETPEQQVKEYFATLVEDVITDEGLLRDAPASVKRIIFDQINEFTTVKYLQDAKTNISRQTATGRQADARTTETVGRAVQETPGDQAGAETDNGLGRVPSTTDRGKEINKVFSFEDLFEPSYKKETPETIEVDGIKRPTTNSNGQPIHPTEEGIRNFWKWFGDSKVVDDKGRPLVVYHGTKLRNKDDQPFEAFAPYGDAKLIFASEDPKEANIFTEALGGNVMPVYLRVIRPYKNGKQFDSREEVSIAKLARRYNSDGFVVGDYAPYSGVWSAKNWAVFSPTQIKSATGNFGGFDPNDPRISYKRKRELSPDRKQVLTTGEHIREILVNNKLALENWMKDVETVVPTIEDYENPLLKDALAKSKVTHKLRVFEKGAYKNLINAVANVLKTSGITKEELSHYLIAVHGVERNEKFWNSQPDRAGEDFSGLTELKEIVRAKADPAEQLVIDGMNNEAFAQYYQKQIEDKMDPGQAKELWNSIREISKLVRDEMLDSGMISREYYDELNQMYKNYIPLRAWEDSNPEDFEFSRGVGSYTEPIVRAKGRKSLAEDPLATLLQMANTAYISGERNRVKQAAGELVRNNASALKDVVQYNRTYFVNQGIDAQGNPIIQETIDRPDQALFDQGLVTTKVPKQYTARRTSAQAKEFEVEFYRNGRKYVLVFQGSDPAVARAINNKEASVGLDYLNKVVGTDVKIGKITIPSINKMSRYLSSINTTYSVDFPLVNFVRDAPMAILSEWVYGDAKEVAKMFPNMKRAEAAMRRMLRGNADPANNADDAQLEDFFKAGGPTGFAFLKNVDEFKQSITNDVRRINRIKNPLVRMEVGFRKGLDLIGQLAEWSETITRFGVYLNHIQNGESKEKAALAAKNAIVNFDQKGRISPALNGLYTFFNAAVQAVDKYFKLWGRDPYKMGGIHMFLMVQAFMNAMLLDLFGGEDEDKVKNYDKVSDYTKRNNLVIPVPGTDKTVSIAVPQILRKFHATGFDAYDLLSGRKTAEQVMLDELASIPSDVSPIDAEAFLNGEGDLSMKPLVPSILRPIVELEANENFMKMPIVPEPFSIEMAHKIADTRRAYKDVNKIAQWTTDKLYELGGGDETGFKYVYDNGELHNVPALLDISPESIEHLFESYFGGVGKLANRTWKTTGNIFGAGKKLYEGENFKEAIKEIDINTVPVANRFVRTPVGDPLQKEFRKVRNDMENKIKVLDQAEKDQDWAKFEKMYEEIGGKINDYKAIMTTFENLDKAYSIVSKEDKKAAEDLKAQMREQMKEIVKLK